MSIYKWLDSIIKEREQVLRNFICTGNPSLKKGITVVWHKVCKPLFEGGLGVKSMKEVNLALLMKLAWQIVSRNGAWLDFIRGKLFTCSGEMIKYYKYSSIWLGALEIVKENSVVDVLAPKGHMVPFKLNYTMDSVQGILNFTMDGEMFALFYNGQQSAQDDAYEA
ncbi:hypothetical protein GIB67_009016 [Kingdonia uniflora]|uniref:Uncharacterized protein n=1 Tax=Kingdonia uniflora TaxID=39325 RepID=A0A7J7LW25_9MAGN|nr:hypothetical protein GIB67_009016 [Kingdonia uniflora]